MQKNKDKLRTKPSEKISEIITIANLVADGELDSFEKLDISKFSHNELFGLALGLNWVKKNFEHNAKLKEYLLNSTTLSDLDERFNFFIRSRELLSTLVKVSEEYEEELAFNKRMNLGQAIKNPSNYAEPVAKKFAEQLAVVTFDVRSSPRFSFTSLFSAFSSTFTKRADLGTRLLESLSKDASKFFINKSEHRLSFAFTGLFEEIHDHDIRRFRKCKECKSFFWAYRLDQICCSKKCSIQARQKKVRSNEKKRHVINARRSKNRFDKQVIEARATLRKAKDGAEKQQANDKLLAVIKKRQNAAKKLNKRKEELKEGESNVNLQKTRQ